MALSVCKYTVWHCLFVSTHSMALSVCKYTVWHCLLGSYPGLRHRCQLLQFTHTALNKPTVCLNKNGAMEKFQSICSYKRTPKFFSLDNKVTV